MACNVNKTLKIEIKYQLNNPSIPQSSVGALIGRYRLKNDSITTRFEVLTNDVSSSLDVVLCIIVRVSVNKVIEARSVIKRYFHYRIVASTNSSHFEAHAGLFRLSIGISDVYGL